MAPKKRSDQIDLQIEKKYLDQVIAGTKPEEYRSLSTYNVHLLCDKINLEDIQPGDHYVTNEDNETWRPRTDIKTLRLLNGYRKDRKIVIIEAQKIEVVKFEKEQYGFKPGAVCFAIKLGHIVESN